MPESILSKTAHCYGYLECQVLRVCRERRNHRFVSQAVDHGTYYYSILVLDSGSTAPAELPCLRLSA